MTKPRWSKKSFSPIVVAFWLRKSREDLDFRRRGEIQMGKVWQTYAWIAAGASRGRYFNNLAEEIEREFWLSVRLLMISLNGGIRRIVPFYFIGWLVRFRFATKFFLEWKLDLHSQILVERPVNLSNHVTNVWPSISIFRCKRVQHQQICFSSRRIKLSTWTCRWDSLLRFPHLAELFLLSIQKRSANQNPGFFPVIRWSSFSLIIARGTLPVILFTQPIKSIQQDGAFQVRRRRPFCIGSHHNSVRIDNWKRMVELVLRKANFHHGDGWIPFPIAPIHGQVEVFVPGAHVEFYVWTKKLHFHKIPIRKNPWS